MDFKENFNDRLEELTESLAESDDTYAYIKSVAKYYWKEKKRFFRPQDVANNIMATNKELNGLRSYGIIQSYDDVCYFSGGRAQCLNLLDEAKILLPGVTPVLHPLIQELIENVCGKKEENIEYIHKAILYKYSHLNDFTLPAVVFYGTGGSGKGSFIALLGKIFGEDNILGNLGQRDISGSFDTYKGQKLIVEFAEISTNNTYNDIKILNKLKNIIGAEKITVNEKGVQAYQIDNIAWFFISSNSNKPLQLDERDKGNRRFSVIRSYEKLKNGKEIHDVLSQTIHIQNYLAWLHEKYPEVLRMKRFEALDNQDKLDLEERSQSESNCFWDWYEENFPQEKKKMTKVEVELLVEKYCFENNIETREFLKYFWHHSRYQKKKIRLGDKTFYGVDMIS